MSPERIHEDVLRCWTENMLAIQRAKGVVIQGLGDRNGDRRVAATYDLVTDRRGGSRPTHAERVKQIQEAGLENVWVHPDARESWEKLIGINE